jgi:hypothetical protein
LERSDLAGSSAWFKAIIFVSPTLQQPTANHWHDLVLAFAVLLAKDPGSPCK